LDLFRVFDWDGSSAGRRDGGPLFVARTRQGAGRHDAPALYGAWYCALEPVSAVAESIQYLRGSRLTDADFRRAGNVVKALVGLRLDPGVPLIDLDDPSELTRRGLRPSRVATMDRPVTQRIAASIFEEGAAGLRWWSTLEAAWTNVTLFHERALPRVAIEQATRPLTVRMPEVQAAAAHLGIQL
jgi:hypothetical protein